MAKTTKKGKKNKWLKLVFILLGSAVFIGTIFLWYNWSTNKKVNELIGGSGITSSKLALTLLTKDEVESATHLEGSLFPQLPQFSDQLAVDDVNHYNQKDLVARSFIGKNTDEVSIENALSLYDSQQAAEDFIMGKAGEFNAKTTRSFENQVLTLVITSNGDANTVPSSTMRFAIGNLVAKITVYGDNKTIDYTNPQLLTSVVESLATKQKEKMEMLLSGNVPGVEELSKTNMARDNFPNTIPDTELIGKALITQYEWLGEIKDTKRETIPGFVSGMLGRFKIQGNANQVLDILVMEYTNHEAAVAEQSAFFTEGAFLADKSSKKLSLPASLNSFSVASVNDSIAELQAVKGNYLYDIAIQSPFAEKFDKDQATNYLLKYSEKILK